MSSAQGRFTSPDRPFLDQHLGNPQSWNLYTYTRNNPLRFVDDQGEAVKETVSVRTYQVSGRSADEAFANARVVSGLRSDGVAMSAETRATVQVDYTQRVTVQPALGELVPANATAAVTSADVNLNQTITMPVWTDRDKAPPGEQKAWDQGMATLKTHEDGHTQINREEAKKLDESLPGTKAYGNAPTTTTAEDQARRRLTGL